MRLWQRFWHRIGVFVAYAPILWRDFDWDHGFLLELLSLKLRRMCAALSGPNAVAFQSRNEMRRLLMCAEICRRLHECDYGKAEYERLSAKYDTKNRPWWDRLNNRTPQESFEWGQWAERSTAQEKAEWDLLWTTIRKHGRTWWD